MRIIAGSLKGRNLIGPPPSERRIRPASDRARGAIFNLLSHNGLDFEGSSGLDIYAGTGALGLEAVSRGATSVTWVDRLPLALGIVKKNLESFKLPVGDDFELAHEEALSFISHVTPANALRWIFVMPPYADQETHLVLEKIAERAGAEGFLEHGAFVVMEVSKRDKRDFAAYSDKTLEYFESRIYGDALVHFWRKP